ncbi:DUF4234 domain-containing protein [Methanohalophilus mahii]|uniref:DUF4234 domain-containing protein n=1 Tax=Methanohalophilus mahii (strain ATCC 35705 / DSM 5219 / SLP) TaxID=547558 RepID=D5E9Y8_METMS|nr:DUF4234 domain-containing protein [Methanohalophilus mahii]ADE35989.1 hypothetical protein Mmah_0459 [Methanohalophilus mahii DSM 5219]
MNDSNNNLNSTSIPLWKFILLSLITFGIYEIYWMYKQWKFLKLKDDLNISPFWRSILAIIFLHELLERIATLADNVGYEKASSTKMNTFRFVFWFLTASINKFQIPLPFGLITYLHFLALINAVQSINFYWKINDTF